MDENLTKWRKEGKHLPDFLKDFHDQKDFFRFLHEFTHPEEHEMVKNINWQQSHAYAIDILLWSLSRFGWTLQRNRSNQKFDDLDAFIKIYTDKRNESFNNMLMSQIKKNQETDKEEQTKTVDDKDK